MSEAAVEIFEPKMNSVVADMQRTLRFSDTRVVLKPFAAARAILLVTLTEWFGKYEDFASGAISLGLRMSPVIEGSKTHLVVTGLMNTDHRYAITVYNESKASLTWTTFVMQKSRFSDSKCKFRYTQETVKGYSRDRMSIDGQGEYAEARRNFKINMEMFAKLYNKKMGDV